jgi:hypothetical protein
MIKHERIDCNPFDDHFHKQLTVFRAKKRPCREAWQLVKMIENQCGNSASDAAIKAL